MITNKDRLFNLSTKRTTYLFAVTETGHLSTSIGVVGSPKT
jgi:alpha-galactosidase